MSVVEKARELAAELAGSVQLTDLHRAEEQLWQDREARDLYGDLLRSRQEALQQEARGDGADPELAARVVEIEEQSRRVPALDNYLKAKAEFDALLQAVNSILIAAVRDPAGAGPADKCRHCHQDGCHGGETAHV